MSGGVEFVRDTQEEAVEEAVRRARQEGGIVHVFGAREDPDLLAGETVCGPERTPAAEVVYHPRAVRLTTGGWACASCGETGSAAELPTA